MISIPGCTFGTPALSRPPVIHSDLEQTKATARIGEEDVKCHRL